MLSDKVATALATDRAFAHTGEQSYLPTNVLEAIEFVPHAWVVDAIQKAYVLGTDAGVNVAKTTETIFSDLQDRSVFNGIDDDIQEEIKEEIKATITGAVG